MTETAGTGMNGPKGASLIAGLLEGRTAIDAGRRANIPERTMRRWLADPAFQRRLQEAQEELIKRVRRRVGDRAWHATDALAQIAMGEAPADPVRVAAARALLHAFVQLQPRRLDAEVTTHERQVIDYRFEGIDPEALL